MLAIFYIVAWCLADVLIYEPQRGDHFDKEVVLKWKDTPVEPSITEVEYYTFILCKGPNDDIEPLQTLKNVTSEDYMNADNSVVLPLKVNPGVYFIQVTLVGKNFYTIHYSERFLFKSDSRVTETAPSPQQGVPGEKTTSYSLVPSSVYTIPYLLQTFQGARYAPAQPSPPSSYVGRRWTALTTQSISLRKFTRAGGYVDGSQVTPVVHYTITQAPTSVAKTSSIDMDHEPAPTGGYNPTRRIKKPTRKLSKLTSTRS